MPHAFTDSTAISAREKAKQPDEAMKLLEEVLQKGLVPGVFTYRAAISALG